MRRSSWQVRYRTLIRSLPGHFWIGSLVALVPWLALVLLFLSAPLASMRKVPKRVVVGASLIGALSVLSGRLDLEYFPTLLFAALGVGVGRVSRDLISHGGWSAFFWGLTVGTSLKLLVGTIQVVAPQLIALLPLQATQVVLVPGRASGWLGHPNLWAISVAAPSLFVLAGGFRRARGGVAIVSSVAGFGVILTAGSRAALIGLVAGATWLVSRREVWARGKRYVSWAILLAFALGGTTLLVSGYWRDRVLGTLRLDFPVERSSPKNLLQSSEDASDPVWWKNSVEVERVAEAQSPYAVQRVSLSTGTQGTHRLQQRVRLNPLEAYTLSFDFRARTVGQPHGVAVFAWNDPGTVPAGFEVRADQEGATTELSTGAIDNVSTELVKSAGWWRLVIHFANAADEEVALQLGIGPWVSGSSSETAALLEMRRLQLEQGDQATTYAGTYPPDRTRLRANSAVESRMALYKYLVEKIRLRPWTGWGAGAYAQFRSSNPEVVALRPTHEHSLPLAIALSFGLLGLIAFAMAMWGMAGNDVTAWSMMVAVLTTNLFDLTFTAASTYLPLALLCGASAGIGGAITPNPRVVRGAPWDQVVETKR